MARYRAETRLRQQRRWRRRRVLLVRRRLILFMTRNLDGIRRLHGPEAELKGQPRAVTECRRLLQGIGCRIATNSAAGA